MKGAALIAALPVVACTALAEEASPGSTFFSIATEDGEVIEAALRNCKLTITTRYDGPYLGADQLHFAVGTVELRGVGAFDCEETDGHRVVMFWPHVTTFARFLETPAYRSEKIRVYRDGRRSVQWTDSLAAAVFPPGLLTEAETAPLESAWRSCAPRLLRRLRQGLG